jgi:hypothetical protein
MIVPAIETTAAASKLKEAPQTSDDMVASTLPPPPAFSEGDVAADTLTMILSPVQKAAVGGKFTCWCCKSSLFNPC